MLAFPLLPLFYSERALDVPRNIATTFTVSNMVLLLFVAIEVVM
jgi:hypothetical protein